MGENLDLVDKHQCRPPTANQDLCGGRRGKQGAPAWGVFANQAHGPGAACTLTPTSIFGAAGTAPHGVTHKEGRGVREEWDWMERVRRVSDKIKLAL